MRIEYLLKTGYIQIRIITNDIAHRRVIGPNENVDAESKLIQALHSTVSVTKSAISQVVLENGILKIDKIKCDPDSIPAEIADYVKTVYAFDNGRFLEIHNLIESKDKLETVLVSKKVVNMVDGVPIQTTQSIYETVTVSTEIIENGKGIDKFINVPKMVRSRADAKKDEVRLAKLLAREVL